MSESSPARRALVTGASRGIGAAIAKALARAGHPVVLVARREHALAEVVSTIRAAGGTADAVAMDLAPWEAGEAVVDRATELLGGAPEIVCISHGALIPTRTAHAAEQGEVDAALASDLRGPMAIIGAAAPTMMRARYGRVVVIGSVLGRMGMPGSAINSMVKAGLEGLVRNVAADLGRYGVTANLVAPGFVDTERQADRGATDEARASMAKAAAIRRMVTADEVAAVVAFLASELASAVTGTVVEVDGGLHLGHALR